MIQDFLTLFSLYVLEFSVACLISAYVDVTYPKWIAVIVVVIVIPLSFLAMHLTGIAYFKIMDQVTKARVSKRKHTDKTWS